MLEFVSPTALYSWRDFRVFLFTLTDKAIGGEGGGFVIGVVGNARVRHRRRTEYD